MYYSHWAASESVSYCDEVDTNVDSQGFVGHDVVLSIYISLLWPLPFNEYLTAVATWL